MKKNNVLTIGLSVIFLVIALIVLGDLLGAFKANNIFGAYWPVILIFIGILSFGPSKQSNSFGFGMLGLGILFTLRNLGVFSSQSGDVVFLVLICLVALAILVLSTEKRIDN